MKTIPELLDKYYPEGPDRVGLRRARALMPNHNDIALILFGMHAHAEIVAYQYPEQIVYREKDIVELLEALGHPVKWGK